MRPAGGRASLEGPTIIDDSPGVEKEGVQGKFWFLAPWLIIFIQARHSGGDLQVAEAEGKREDIGNSGIH